MDLSKRGVGLMPDTYPKVKRTLEAGLN